MKTVTTKHLLEYLPIDKEIKTKILADFDKFTEDQKLETKKICWLMFFDLCKARTEREFKKALLAVKDKKAKLKGNLYQEIEDKVFQEVKDELMRQGEESKVGEVRKELQEMLQKKVL